MTPTMAAVIPDSGAERLALALSLDPPMSRA
jgi:hypothetical protein